MHEDFVNDGFAGEDTGSEYDELDRSSIGSGDYDAPEPGFGADEPYEDQAPDEEGTEPEESADTPALPVGEEE